MRFARSVDGLVVETFDAPDTIPFLISAAVPASVDDEGAPIGPEPAVHGERPIEAADIFPAAPEQLRSCGPEVEQGWVEDGAGFAPSPPLPAPTLSDLRAARLVEVDAHKSLLLAAGYPAAGDLHVALDDGSRADVTAMGATALAAGGGVIDWPESYALGWITIENVRIPLPSLADGLALAAAVGTFYAAIVQHARNIKDAVLGAEDEAALDAVDIEAGWPS